MAKKHSISVGATTLTDITGGGIEAGEAGTYFLAICNRETTARTFRLAITEGAAATPADYVNYDAEIEANGSFSRWPVPLAAGWKVWIYASGTGLSATLIGLEEV